MDKYQYVLNVIKRNLIDNHVAFIFEKVCLEFLWNILLPFEPLKVGRWWDGDNEIDVVGINSFENSIIFGECKFWDKKIGMNVLINLKEKAKGVKCLKKDRKEYFILFSKLGFNADLIEAEKRGEVILYSLH
jgi:AAA+ ATPase superfamily predicted ATPase